MRITLLFLSFCVFYVIGMKLNASKFNLRPSVPSSESVELDGVSCTFSYSADGGSSEEWDIQLEKSGDKYACVVGRPGSYLFFKQFKIQLSGKKIDSVVIRDNDSVFSNSDYVISPGDNSVSSKQGWMGSLASIIVESS
eukprot:TRINITY_DN3127_c3_g1_i3.p1 TRINITY_DN3127_c3_g1~~TRINITY_DN3127_c3_g1_i3.p1  ORF type:complete len:139 (+),score=12.36 TRINITY_DN3127_c3_g1_i3:43-459(+)